MHELPIIQSIFDIVVKHAKKNKVKKVLKITISISELSDLENEWMQHYFDYLSKDSICHKAKMIIVKRPITMECESCSKSYDVGRDLIDKIVCPICKNSKAKITSGSDYFIKDMEVI
jgi:hydrogenase nickel incorporation protein HypA/HybF